MAIITVFGGSGNIGRQVVKLIAQNGDQVRVAVRDPHAALFLKSMGDVGQITPIQSNIRDAASVQSAVDGADAIVNLVGILCEKGAQKFQALHSQGVLLIARAAVNSGISSVVHIAKFFLNGLHLLV